MRKVVLRGGAHPHYASSAISSTRSRRQRAVRFDAEALEVVGAPVQALERHHHQTESDGEFQRVGDGHGRLHQGQDLTSARRSIVWVDRDGREEPVGAPRVRTPMPSFCPTTPGLPSTPAMKTRHLDLAHRAKNDDSADARPGISRSPVGSRRPGVGSHSRRRGVASSKTVWQAADGSSPAEPINSRAITLVPKSFSPDGRWLILSPGIQPFDLHIVDLKAAAPRPQRLLVTPFKIEREISPDGKWLAYQSNESGRLRSVRPAVSGCDQGALSGVDRRRHPAGVGTRWAAAVLLARQNRLVDMTDRASELHRQRSCSTRPGLQRLDRRRPS